MTIDQAISYLKRVEALGIYKPSVELLETLPEEAIITLAETLASEFGIEPDTVADMMDRGEFLAQMEE